MREVTDGTGVLRASYEYALWGKRTKLAGDLDCDFGFTGHYQHGPSGFVVAPLRFYTAELGRWLSRDPIEEEGGLNLYAYVFNQPARLVDPLGLEIRVYSDTSLGGLGNHAFVHSTETGISFGRQASSGQSSRPNNDGGGNLNSPYRVVLNLNGMSEAQFMDALRKSPHIDNGLWFPGANDCHSDLKDAFQALGVKFPGVVNGRNTDFTNYVSPFLDGLYNAGKAILTFDFSGYRTSP